MPFLRTLPALVLLTACQASAPGTGAAVAATTAPSGEDRFETFTLANGMTVVLMPDDALPKVVIDTWFRVGSKDEAPGRSGFAHLFEHLMFMGTGRVPDNQFDVLMETGGGSNNASTGTDVTNYFSMGPASLLPTLVWLDADRLDALDEFMTQEKLDRQRDVVRNERRQTTENVPYGKEELLLPAALYPEGHPYHHSVIGSHEDLEAATLEDVIAFFREFYVPSNATLVVAGDFDPAATRQLVEDTFGVLQAKPAPRHMEAPPVVLEGVTRVVDYDRVELAKLTLAWHSPAGYAPGDAELDLLASVLADGPSSRLEKRLVDELRIAQEVSASQLSAELGSIFQVDVIASPDADLDVIEREVLAILDDVQRSGVTADELARAQARQESRFLRRNESLLSRAESVQAYRRHFGVSDGFQRDLERWTKATREGVRSIARDVLSRGHVDLRLLPQVDESLRANLDTRPEDLPRAAFTPPVAQEFTLSNGIRVVHLERPGSGLFAGSLVVDGGETVVDAAQAGVPGLAARWIDSGAGERDQAAFAEAVEALGASMGVRGGRRSLDLSVSGLSSRLAPTLDLFADLVLRPRLEEDDFAREKDRALNDVRSRDDRPNAVASDVGRALVFGPDDPRGRPSLGTEASIGGASAAGVRALLPRLVTPARATFVFAGDVDRETLRAALEARFGGWKGESSAPLATQAPRTEPASGPNGARIVLVAREGAPQTVISILRPLATAEGQARATRDVVDTVLGGTFTSRLNANLREDKGYTYGARSRIEEDGPQSLLVAGAAVVTAHTGDSLLEFQREFQRLEQSGITPDELDKAVASLRTDLVDQNETTAGQARSLAALVADGRPLDAARKDLAALDCATVAAATQLAASGPWHWDDLLVVLVGDPMEVRKQLAEAGFPAPVEVDSSGRPLAPGH